MITKYNPKFILFLKNLGISHIDTGDNCDGWFYSRLDMDRFYLITVPDGHSAPCDFYSPAIVSNYTAKAFMFSEEHEDSSEWETFGKLIENAFYAEIDRALEESGLGWR